jgi:arylsulfatase A-like enzyme
VPGVFFCTHRIDREDPALVDIAPTALELFGVEPPRHMDGVPLFTGSELRRNGSAGPGPEEVAPAPEPVAPAG